MPCPLYHRRLQKRKYFFFSKHKIGALLKKCNGTKEKGVSAVSSNIFKYKYTNANNYLLQAKYLVKTTTVSNDSLIYKGELEGIKIYQESSHDYMYLMYRKKVGLNILRCLSIRNDFIMDDILEDTC